MADLTYATGGESHGPGLTVIVSGLPAGLTLKPETVDAALAERQKGHGRGSRMTLEKDAVEILGGLYRGKTLGDPVVFFVRNKDDSLESLPPVTKPRPGHADLAGCLKYGWKDARGVLERASARETAVRTAAGAAATELLRAFGVRVFSHVAMIGGVEARPREIARITDALEEERARSDHWCLDGEAAAAQRAAIDRAVADGDTLGGVMEVVVGGVVPGLGSSDDRLDANLAGAVMGVPAIKGVEIGAGFALAALPGSKAHDEIRLAQGELSRPTNRAGGLEGGMTNGEPVVLRAVMKPIPTLGKPLGTFDWKTLGPAEASKVRSDACAVPAASVVVRSVVAFEIARAYRRKFGGDTLADMLKSFEDYRRRVEEMLKGS
jgi:chorismate synthase